MESVEFICKCGEQKGWIAHGEVKIPCPKCGRIYKGAYDNKKYTIKAIEIDVES